MTSSRLMKCIAFPQRYVFWGLILRHLICVDQCLLLRILLQTLPVKIPLLSRFVKFIKLCNFSILSKLWMCCWKQVYKLGFFFRLHLEWQHQSFVAWTLGNIVSGFENIELSIHKNTITFSLCWHGRFLKWHCYSHFYICYRCSWYFWNYR